MPLDPSIFLQGAALQNRNAENLQAQLQRGLDLYTAGKQKQAELKAKGLDLDNMIDGIILKSTSGQELTPQDQAVFNAWQEKRMTEQMTDPYGNTVPKYRALDLGVPVGHQNGGIYGALAEADRSYKPTYTQDSPFPAGFKNGAPSDIPADASEFPQMSVLDVEAMLPQNINQQEPIQDQGFKGVKVDSPIAQTPYGQKATLDASIDVAKDAAKEDAKLARTKADEESKKLKGREVFQKSLDRMAEITEELKRKEAIIYSGGKNNAVNLGATTGAGQFVSRGADPEVQALRDEFLSLRNQLGNAVMAADGMSSKQMDSNAEREAFMKSLGGPDLSYEANKSIQQNLGSRYGIPKNKQGTPSQSDPLGLFN